MESIEIVSHDDGEYRVRVGSLDGDTSVILVLDEADDVSGGRLTNDETTARATMAFLLGHQDASDLPGRLEIEDVLAAYPDAVEAIASLRA